MAKAAGAPGATAATVVGTPTGIASAGTLDTGAEVVVLEDVPGTTPGAGLSCARLIDARNIASIANAAITAASGIDLRLR
ncbi:MAG TPA: hypothetical protein VKR29_05930, partial [Candidatus Binataceae bacterium]|nr:hypothetical protein [Candidatus Binataceae bacterium]